MGSTGTITTIPKSGFQQNNPIDKVEIPFYGCTNLNAGIVASVTCTNAAYTTGTVDTAGILTNVLTGYGTTFAQGHVGGVITITGYGTAVITEFNSTTQITVSTPFNITHTNTAALSITFAPVADANNGNISAVAIQGATITNPYSVATVSTNGFSNLITNTATSFTPAMVGGVFQATNVSAGSATNSIVIAYLSTTQIMVQDTFNLAAASSCKIYFNNQSALYGNSSTSSCVYYNQGMKKRLNYRIINSILPGQTISGITLPANYNSINYPNSFVAVFYIPLRDLHPLYQNQHKPT